MRGGATLCRSFATAPQRAAGCHWQPAGACVPQALAPLSVLCTAVHPPTAPAPAVRPAAPVLFARRSHLTHVYTYGKGKASASHPCRRSVARRLSGFGSGRRRSPTCFRSFQNNVAGHFGSTRRLYLTPALPPRPFIPAPAPSVGGSRKQALRVSLLGRVRSTPPTLF